MENIKYVIIFKCENPEEKVLDFAGVKGTEDDYARILGFKSKDVLYSDFKLDDNWVIKPLSKTIIKHRVSDLFVKSNPELKFQQYKSFEDYMCCYIYVPKLYFNKFLKHNFFNYNGKTLIDVSTDLKDIDLGYDFREVIEPFVKNTKYACKY